MSRTYGEQMLAIAVTTRQKREQEETDNTERGYPYVCGEIRKWAVNEQTSIRFDRVRAIIHGKSSDKLLIEMLTSDGMFVYTDKSETPIGIQMVTWDPEVAAYHVEENAKRDRDHLSP